MYAFGHDNNLTRSRITECRIKKNPFVTALTCEWYLYFCLNQTRSPFVPLCVKRSLKENISAVDMHFEGYCVVMGRTMSQ